MPENVSFNVAAAKAAQIWSSRGRALFLGQEQAARARRSAGSRRRSSQPFALPMRSRDAAPSSSGFDLGERGRDGFDLPALRSSRGGRGLCTAGSVSAILAGALFSNWRDRSGGWTSLRRNPKLRETFHAPAPRKGVEMISRDIISCGWFLWPGVCRRGASGAAARKASHGLPDHALARTLLGGEVCGTVESWWARYEGGGFMTMAAQLRQGDGQTGELIVAPGRPMIASCIKPPS